jgi:N-acetylmuramoyl-L-alanine amidase
MSFVPCLQLCRLMALLAGLAALPAQAFTTVVIDAGHGGKDPGGYWYGTTEKRLCLDVAKRLQTALQAKGFKTVMTRTTDVYVELEDRAAKANRYRNAIFVSIHFNASLDRTISGFETHYRSKNGRVLAQSIQSALDRNIPGTNRGIHFRDYKVLRATHATAALVECGFISNKREYANCNSPAHRQKLANAIASGIAAVKGKL